MKSREAFGGQTSMVFVSSVCLQAVTLEENWQPPEYPKTDEETARLQARLTSVIRCQFRRERLIASGTAHRISRAAGASDSRVSTSMSS